MKQSTKLLSLVLALLIAFSCMSVIGSAALVKGEIAYDTIDDADLSYTQVANIACDLVDQLLVDLDQGKLFDVLGLSVDLTNINTTFSSLYNTSQNVLFKLVSGLLGDIGSLDFTPLADADGNPYQRGTDAKDYDVLCALLNFIGCEKNADTLSNAAYGIGTSNGIDLGSIIGGLLDLGEIGDMLADIPGLLVGLVYDMLIYGSYGYDKDLDDIKAAKSTLTATYPEMDTLDEMVPNALINLLTKPQEYEWEGEGEDAKKVWDMNSVIMPGLTLTGEDINPLKKSLFQILDVAAQIAIDEIAIPALNNNLKKALMEAVEADLNEIDATSLPAEVKTAFDNTASYVTYFAYDKIMKSGSTWYYTTLKTDVVIDATTGEPEVDVEGNEVTERVRKYYKVNMGAANEFASLINWDWDFVGSDVTPGEGQTALIYDDIKAINGSLVGGINNLLGMVYDVALSESAKADFVAQIQEYVDDTFTGWITDATDEYDNANLNTNVEYLLKYILTSFGDKVFGTTSEYANYTMEDVAYSTIIDMVAMIGPGFFEDAMPQIILPKDAATGEYAFHSGSQLWEFGAVVLRELITGIAPIVNYDSYIFAAGDVTSADDRQFVDYEGDNDAWFNIILNMGIDVGLVYLQQLTNIQDFFDSEFGTGYDIDKDLINAGNTTDAHWMDVLDKVILWALDYIGGERSTGVLAGINYNYLNTTYKDDPIGKLSYIFNTLLPLGFVGDGTYTSADFDLDLSLVVDGFKAVFNDFDLTAILSLLGRNTSSKYNLLDDASLGTAILDLVNDILYLVFGNTVLQNVKATGTVATQSLDGVISQASLKTTVKNILMGLNTRKHDILKNGAPVLAKLIKEWGGEQEFNSPSHDMGTFVTVQENGSTYYEVVEEDGGGSGYSKYDTYSVAASPITVNVKNNSEGVWRHYVDASGKSHQDEQYQIEIASVEAYNYDGTASTFVSKPTINTTGKIGFGQSGSFTFNVGSFTCRTDEKGGSGSSMGDKTAIPNEGALVKFKIGYKVYLEDGTTALLSGKVFYDESYVWLSRYAGDNRKEYKTSSDAYRTSVYSPTYIPYYEDDIQATLDIITGTKTGEFLRNSVTVQLDTSATFYVNVASSPDTDGITLGSVSVDTADNKNYQTLELRMFDTYTADWIDADDGTTVHRTVSFTGSVPTADVFAQNVTADEVNSAAGASSSWTVNIAAKDGKNNYDGAPLVLKYYNSEARDNIIDLVESENGAMREAKDYKHYYNSSATVTVSEALENTDTVDSNGNFVLRETNFAPNANGETVINCAQAWTNYYNALQAALPYGLQEWNPASKFDFEAKYNALRVAVNDIERCYATEDDGAQTLGTDVDALEVALRASQATRTDLYNHTDYKMYRHNRYNDARDDANWYINLRKDAQPSINEIDQYFDYNWMEENDYLSLIGAHTVKFGEKAGTSVAKNEYYNYLEALLKDFSEEEITSKEQWLANKKVEFARISEMDLAMAENYLDITGDRLLKRDCGVIYDQLNDEITSAQNMIGTTNNGYTAGSWANYIEAYNAAVDAQDCGSQKQVFDAKYELLVQRKNLVKVGEEADYAELNALIANAEFALENPTLYESNITGMSIEKIFGMVLAELGMDPITSVDGYDVQLFPGSAYITVENAYSVDDQDKVDDAAWVLKEALARLTFKGLAVKEIPNNNKVVGKEILVEDNDETTDVNEQVDALVSHLNALQDEAAVKAFFAVDATNANVTVDDIIVTNDVNFSVSYEGAEAFTGYAGTNSTVTFYTTYNGVKLPVATVKIVVDGDINGDGAVDVLDAAYGALVAAEKGELRGCYLLAGDLSNGDRLIKDTDYQQIVNKAVA